MCPGGLKHLSRVDHWEWGCLAWKKESEGFVAFQYTQGVQRGNSFT